MPYPHEVPFALPVGSPWELTSASAEHAEVPRRWELFSNVRTLTAGSQCRAWHQRYTRRRWVSEAGFGRFGPVRVAVLGPLSCWFPRSSLTWCSWSPTWWADNDVPLDRCLLRSGQDADPVSAVDALGGYLFAAGLSDAEAEGEDGYAATARARLSRLKQHTQALQDVQERLHRYFSGQA